MSMLGDSQAEEERDREAARAANDHYTGEPCKVCGRIRVYLRTDGQTQCEKCETIFPPSSQDSKP